VHKVPFCAGDTTQIFRIVGKIPPTRTVLVVDPPYKRCDEEFVR
jgi:hypothetical protein